MQKQRDLRNCPIRIERATAADLDQMIALLGELFTLERDFAAQPERQAAGLRLLLDRADRAAVLVARDGADRITGMITAQLVVSTAEGALSAWIEDVIVRREMRGRGVGRALIEAVLEWSRKAGATRAQLLIDTENEPAEGFYARLGWRKTQLSARRVMLK